MANMDIGTLKSQVRAALSAGGDFSLVLPDLDAPSLFDYKYEDFTLVDYRHHPALKAPVAV